MLTCRKFAHRYSSDPWTEGTLPWAGGCRFGYCIRLVSVSEGLELISSVFVLIMNTLFFPLGLHKVGHDYNMTDTSSVR